MFYYSVEHYIELSLAVFGFKDVWRLNSSIVTPCQQLESKEADTFKAQPRVKVIISNVYNCDLILQGSHQVNNYTFMVGKRFWQYCSGFFESSTANLL